MTMAYSLTVQSRSLLKIILGVHLAKLVPRSRLFRPSNSAGLFPWDRVLVTRYLAKALREWRKQTKYRALDDGVFASPASCGRRPYWAQSIMRNLIRPAAVELGITERIGWHTFRHTYSSLLRATGADIKVMQELLRHASSRVTLDTYTQAVTLHKRKVQSDVIRLFRASDSRGG